MPYGYQHYGGGLMPLMDLENKGQIGQWLGYALSPDRRQDLAQNKADWWDESIGDWIPGTPGYIRRNYEPSMVDPSLQGIEGYDLDNIQFGAREQEANARQFFRDFLGNIMGRNQGMHPALQNQQGSYSIQQALQSPLAPYFNRMPPEQYFAQAMAALQPQPTTPNFMQPYETGGTVSPNPKLQELLDLIGQERRSGEVPIMAHQGEVVMNKDAVNMLGEDQLNTLNQIAQMPRYEDGGTVDRELTAEEIAALIASGLVQAEAPPAQTDPALIDRVNNFLGLGGGQPISPPMVGGRLATPEELNAQAMAEAIAQYSLTQEQLGQPVPAPMQQSAGGIPLRTGSGRTSSVPQPPVDAVSGAAPMIPEGADTRSWEELLHDAEYWASIIPGFDPTQPHYRGVGEGQHTTNQGRGVLYLPSEQASSVPPATIQVDTRNMSAGHESLADYPEPPPDIDETGKPSFVPQRDPFADLYGRDIPQEEEQQEEGEPQQEEEEGRTQPPLPAPLRRPATQYRQKHQGLGLDINYMQNADPNDVISYLYEVASRRENPQMTRRQRMMGMQEPEMPYTERMFSQMMQLYSQGELTPEAIREAGLRNDLMEQRVRSAESEANVATETEQARVGLINAQTQLTAAQAVSQEWQNDFMESTEDQQIETINLNLQNLRTDSEMYQQFKEMDLSLMDAQRRLLMAQALAHENDGTMIRTFIQQTSPADLARMIQQGENVFQDQIDSALAAADSARQSLAQDGLSGNEAVLYRNQLITETAKAQWLSTPESIDATTIDDFLGLANTRAIRRYLRAIEDNDQQGAQEWQERAYSDFEDETGITAEQFERLREGARADIRRRDMVANVLAAYQRYGGANPAALTGSSQTSSTYQIPGGDTQKALMELLSIFQGP